MEVISTRRYEARPPADSHASILVDPTNAVATVKEEEWETRKKKEITTTRQIETRVKRQVVLEDGEVVVDSGPQVTTNTTEDVEQQEHTTQERRTHGDEPSQKTDWPAGVKPGPLVQKELNETIVKSREEIEELLETEDRQQLGDITDEAYLQAVRNNRGDLRVALAESTRQLAGQQPTGPRVLQHTTRSNKVVDTEKTLERSELKQGGQIVTERKTTVEHEEIKDDELPEGINGERDEVDEAREIRKEATQRYVKTRDEDVVDYVQNGERVGREMRFVSETTEAERTGDWPTESPGLRSSRLHKHGFGSDTIPTSPASAASAAAAAAAAAAQSRKDVLTRKPLDLEEEDEARKFETSKWLESHFGSESRSSHGSLDDEPLGPSSATSTKHHNGSSTSYINVTMKSSCGPRDRRHYRHSPGSRQQQQQQHHSRANGRESSSPQGYFQGISEWSERYQSTEKQNTSHVRARSPQQYIVETNRETSQQRLNGHHSPIERSHKETSYTRSYETTRRHQERLSPPHERPKHDPPSPPLRRKAREHVINTKTERNYQQERSSPIERAASPVHVVQRTWESRTRDVREEERHGRSSGRSSSRQTQPLRESHHYHQESTSRRHYSPERTRSRPRSPVSRSASPSPVRRDKKDEIHSRPSKSPSPSKYKIGESFRKLVGKLRSASSERKNKRATGSSSTSQLTQTDDSSTYLQYNTVDRNVPLGPEYDGPPQHPDDRPPERPPRSPRNHVTTSLNVSVNSSSSRNDPKTSSSGKYRSTRSTSPRQHEYKETSTTTQQQRNEQPIHRYYLGEDPYGGSIYGREKGYRETSKLHSRHRSRPVEQEYSAESSSLGRFSKSTSRLAYEYNNEQHNDLDRSSAQTLPRKIHTQTSQSRPAQPQQQHHSTSTTTTTTTTRRLANGHGSSSAPRYNGVNGNGQYGSMINISFKNTVTSPKTTHFVQTSINTQPPQPPPPPPLKPERTYKSTLSRSKSFNVEIADDGVVTTPKTNGYSSNVRSSCQLNRLDETPPLKSPGILASISRSNRDLLRNGRHDY